MGDIVEKAISFIVIIVIAYTLKRVGVFRPEDKKFLGTLLMNVGLPCIAISGFQDFQFDISLFIAMGLVIFLSLLAIMLAFRISSDKHRDIRLLYLMSSCGYNIGIFTIPFVASFFSSTTLLCVLMYDMGNAIFVFGSLAAITSFLVDGNKVNPIATLFKSVPFLAYLLMLVLVVLNIQLPVSVYTFTNIVTDAVPFLAMVLIGLMIEFNIEYKQIKDISAALMLRYGIAIVACILLYHLSRIDYELRKGLMIAVCSPMATSSVVYLQQFKCNPSLIGVTSTLSIIISMIAIVGIVVLM